MSREFKPGDVAMLSSVNGEAAIGLAVGIGDEVNGWRTEGGALWGPRYTDLARPLVVIDVGEPGGIDQVDVDRLDGLLWSLDYTADASYSERYTILDRALREFANPTPPKPDEPQGLGAVVEDADGVLWVRSNPGAVYAWAPESAAAKGNTSPYRPYVNIAAVKVLAPGWSE